MRTFSKFILVLISFLLFKVDTASAEEGPKAAVEGTLMSYTKDTVTIKTGVGALVKVPRSSVDITGMTVGKAHVTAWMPFDQYAKLNTEKK
jgi:hypothetical protein